MPGEDFRRQIVYTLRPTRADALVGSLICEYNFRVMLYHVVRNAVTDYGRGEQALERTVSRERKLRSDDARSGEAESGGA